MEPVKQAWKNADMDTTHWMNQHITDKQPGICHHSNSKFCSETLPAGFIL